MSELQVIFFDVGLGDCTLFKSNDSYTLIDGGAWFPDSLKMYLRKNKICKISNIICTHLHGDHINGLVEVVRDIEFDKVYCNTNIDSQEEKGTFSNFQLEVRKKGIEIDVPAEGEKLYFGDAELTFYNAKSFDKKIDENDKSIVCMVECCDKKILMLSDVQESAMNSLVIDNVPLDADVLRVPHHGMIDLPDSFWERINPAAAIISYGKNRHGGINSLLVEKLRDKKTDIYQTDYYGDITCFINDEGIKFKSSIENDEISTKKLLLFGANSETINHVNTAKKLGVKTIVTDNIDGSPAKRVSDISYDIDGKDVGALIDVCNQEDVDGVLIGVADPLLPSYVEVARKLGFPVLPSCKSDEYIRFFTNKYEFKERCREVGLNVIPEYFAGRDLMSLDMSNIKFPCIVKPTVCRGGKGVRLCQDEHQLKDDFMYAQQCSDNGEVQIEAFMNYKEVCAYYFFQNGIPHLLAVTDRLTLNSSNSISPVTYGNIYPSLLTEKFKNQCGDKFIRIFHDLQIRNGVFAMQIFYDGKDFYPYDPAGILGAELTSPIITEVLEINLIEHFIKYALTGNMQCRLVPSEGGVIPGNKNAETIWILLNPGIISSIIGLDDIEEVKGVLGLIWRLHEGDEVKPDMCQTEKSVLARIWVVADTREELSELEQKIRKRVKVYDIAGNSMILEKSEV